MALYHGGENEAEFVSYCKTSRDPSPTWRDSYLEEVLTGYPNICPLLFTDLDAFQEVCLMHLSNLIEGIQTSQYLAFRDVKKGNVDEIDRMRQEGHGLLPRMTILYDGREEILIVKLMVGLVHEVGAREFAGMFEAKLIQLGLPRNVIVRLGSARFGDSLRRSKEGDAAYKPRSRGMEGDWPTFVIEVGVSESLVELHADAEFWLTKSGGQTCIVIVLCINKSTQEILIERWENAPRTQPVGSSTYLSIGLIQSITLHANVRYNGLALVIPAHRVFDALPQGVPLGEFQITAQDLRDFSDDYWSVLH